MNNKTITVHIPVQLHKDMKREALLRGLTIKDYILQLVNRDIGV